jgi:ABC-type transport system substrate-binding protein
VTRTIAALLCVVVFAACSKVDTTQSASTATSTTTASRSGAALHSWSRPGELRIGVQREPNSLNPLLSANTTEGMINRLSFDTLITVDATGKNFVPSLAAEVP